MTTDAGDAGGRLIPELSLESGRWGPPTGEAERHAWRKAADLVTAEVLASGATILMPNAAAEIPAGVERGSLYNGYSGTCLFLAIAARALRCDSARNLAMRLLPTLEPPAVTTASGALVGPLSLALAWRRLAPILAEPDLLSRAVDLALRHGAPSASRHDLASGNAGSVMVLLDLRAALAPGDARGARLLQLAERCAEEMLRHRMATDGLPATIPPRTDAMPLTGFAHGASGIALALCLLFAENGEREVLRAAASTLDFERALFRHDIRAWPISPDEPNIRPNGWCYGGPGIALARAAILFVLGGQILPQVVGDLRLALEVLWQAPAVPLDHLCCGMLSRVESLRVIAGLLRDERLELAAGAMATWTLRAAKRRGGFGLGGRTPEEDLTLFQGLPGIGYSLLRLLSADDNLSPSALLPFELAAASPMNSSSNEGATYVW
jgi:lantibiotic modifying enzyme